jgi:hypothetical protein
MSLDTSSAMSSLSSLYPMPAAFGGEASSSSATTPIAPLPPILDFGPSTARTNQVSDDVNHLQTRLESMGESLGVDFDDSTEEEPQRKKVRSFEQDMNDSELTFDELFDLNAASEYSE